MAGTEINLYQHYKINEVRFMERNYKTMTAKQFAEKFGRTEGAIGRFLRKHGLRKNKSKHFTS